MKYEIIYLDPPWFRTPCGTAKTPYKTMTWEELHAFDLGNVSKEATGILIGNAIPPKLASGVVSRVMAALTEAA